MEPAIISSQGLPASAPPVHCHLVCLGFHADAPARVALMNAMAVTSYLGCLYCKMTQVSLSVSRRVFMGYASAVQICRGLLRGQWKQMVGSAHICTFARKMSMLFTSELVKH